MPDCINAFVERNENTHYLYGPWVDFLLLGGAALVVMLIYLLWFPGQDTTATLAAAVLIAHAINHPHFAVSYQIFYADFFKKLKGQGYTQNLRLRYLIVGVIIPFALISFFVFSFVAQQPATLGHSVNLMFFLVGWHYVKQGYGCLMVDTTLKKAFFDQAAKRVLLVNCYVCWIYAWINANQLLTTYNYWGINYSTFGFPIWLVTSVMSLAIVTTVVALVILVRHGSKVGTMFPVNGLVGYVSAIYVWTIVPYLNPSFAILIPAFHSLQYIAIAGRYEINRSRSQTADKPKRENTLTRSWISFYRHYIGFFLVSVTLGYLGFWGAPEIIAKYTTLDGFFADGSRAIFFCFWIFINVHHYFLDSVMWRRENPDVRTYLFS